MIVFLPKRADGLAELEKTLTAARVTDWLAKLTPYQVDVTLPRFKVTAEFQLKDTLTDLGMPLAFSLPKADFSGIATVKPLALSAVIHKAFVDVNEKGTEAAAATAATIVTMSAPRARGEDRGVPRRPSVLLRDPRQRDRQPPLRRAPGQSTGQMTTPEPIRSLPTMLSD